MISVNKKAGNAVEVKFDKRTFDIFRLRTERKLSG